MRPEDNEIRDVRIEEVLAWTSTVGKGKCTEPDRTGDLVGFIRLSFSHLRGL